MGRHVMNYVYILRCSDDTLYCGWTTDLKHRIAAHNAGTGCYPSDWLARVSSRFHQIEYLRSIKENARKHGRIFDAVPYCGIMSFCRKT